MRINLLITLPLVLMASIAHSQPYTIGYLNQTGHVSGMADVNGILYFAEANWLYRTDPDHSYVDVFATLAGGSEAVNFTNVNGVLYFTENRSHATVLWRTNDVDGITPLFEFANTFGRISPMQEFEGYAYFGFQDALYRSDGTPAGTVQLKDLDPTSSQGIIRLSAVGETLYISLRKSPGVYELWQSDGTAAGTTMIHSFSYIEFLGSVGDALYFVGDDGSSGRELWMVSGAGMVTMARDINPGSGHSFLEGGNPSAKGNGRLAFSTSTPGGVWVVSTSVSQVLPSSASQIAFAGEKFFFIVGNDVWVTDGASAGTFSIKDFDDIRPDGSRVSNLVSAGTTVFFVVDGMQLWQSNGTREGTIMIYDHTPAGTTPSGSMQLAATDDHLYYFAAFASSGDATPQPDVYSYDPDQVWIPGLTLVNASTEQDIRRLENPAAIVSTEPFSIRADASLATSRVVFSVNGVTTRREGARPFSLAGDNSGNYNAWNVAPGTYQLRATPYSAAGVAGSSVVYQVTVTDSGEGCGMGALVREIWTGIPGNMVSLIPRDRRPNGTQMLTSFEGPSNSGTNYGARIKGYVCPPQSGAYTFWIASNDHSELWLSTDDNPTTKVKIAEVTAATNARQWDKFRSQRSSPIQLEAGKRYYIEAWHKQGTGTDHVAVGWQLPDGAMERPIPAGRLSPFTGNQPPEVRILSLIDGQTFDAPADILIKVEALDMDGWVNRYKIFAGDRLLMDEWSHEFLWRNVPVGSYEIYVRVTDNDGAVATSEPINITVTGGCSASGTITREYWTGVSGSRISDIPVNETPSGEMQLSRFEAPVNAGANYGARIRGYICPPSSGNYTLWIASNDHSELWLSTNDDPANKVRIAWVTGATNPQQWNKFSSQKSASIALQQGQRYYIEALHKQGVGSDHVAVGWQLPDGTFERPIAGNRLSPFSETTGPASYMIYPSDGADGIDPSIMKLAVQSAIGARRYTIELNPAPDFSGSSKIVSSIEDHQTEFVVRGLQHSTTYYVRVRTNASAFGPVATFTTRDPIGLHRLWGITTSGGAYDMGTIFSFSIDSGTFVKHYDKRLYREVYGEGEDHYVDLEEHLGGTPLAGPEGTLYGQSDHAYTHNLFEMNREGEVRWLHPFAFIYNGNIMMASDHKIYVTSSPYLEGGVIDRISLDDLMSLSRIRVFNQKEFGSDPSAMLLELPDGYLYGTAREGGINNGGLLYRIRPNGSEFQIIHYFSSEHGGMNPVAGLKEADGFLYGTTANGGIADGHGTLFRLRPDGAGFTKLYDFDGWNGSEPRGEVLIHNGIVYGVTTKGGASNQGTVFRINVDGTGFDKLKEFSGEDGANPSGGLVIGPDGETLYGMTTSGGSNGRGTIFAVKINGSEFNKLYDFSAWSGGSPEGSMIIREDLFSPSSTMARVSGDEDKVMQVSIHPNPTVDHFEVYVNTSRSESIHVVVTDQYGQLVARYEVDNGTPIQIGSELKRGLYIMKVVQGKNVMMQRMVKK